MKACENVLDSSGTENNK